MVISNIQRKTKKPWVKGRPLGFKQSEDTKQKISNSHKGKKKPWAGKYFTKDGLQRLSLATRKRMLEKPTSFWKGKTRPDISGENHYLWIIDRTEANELARLRTTLEYKVWRESVFKRDNFTCQICLVRSGKHKRIVLNADHIKRFSDYPELRFTISNGRTLCKACHLKQDTHGRPKKKLKELE